MRPGPRLRDPVGRERSVAAESASQLTVDAEARLGAVLADVERRRCPGQQDNREPRARCSRSVVTDRRRRPRRVVCFNSLDGGRQSPSTAGSWSLADGADVPARLIDHRVPATACTARSGWSRPTGAPTGTATGLPTPTSPRQATSLPQPGPGAAKVRLHLIVLKALTDRAYQLRRRTPRPVLPPCSRRRW